MVVVRSIPMLWVSGGATVWMLTAKRSRLGAFTVNAMAVVCGKLSGDPQRPIWPVWYLAPGSKDKSQHVAFWKSRFVENGHRNSGFTWIYPLKIVIFHSYVSLPEGGTPKPVGPDLALISMGICWGTTPTSTRAVSCSSAWTTNIHLTQESPPSPDDLFFWASEGKNSWDSEFSIIVLSRTCCDIVSCDPRRSKSCSKSKSPHRCPKSVELRRPTSSQKNKPLRWSYNSLGTWHIHEHLWVKLSTHYQLQMDGLRISIPTNGSMPDDLYPWGIHRSEAWVSGYVGASRLHGYVLSNGGKLCLALARNGARTSNSSVLQQGAEFYDRRDVFFLGM